MQAFKEKVQSIISKYEEQLSANGIKIAVSKKNFETDVGERSTSYANTGAAILVNMVERAIDRRKEKKYKHERNRYRCIVLSVLPTDKNLIQKGLCKEYGFVLRKVERAHIGQEPQRIQYDERKVLAKIEKRILTILKKSKKVSAQKVCQDTVFDAFRYSVSTKYEFKESFLGKERSTWEIIFMIFIGILALAVALIIYGIGRVF